MNKTKVKIFQGTIIRSLEHEIEVFCASLDNMPYTYELCTNLDKDGDVVITVMLTYLENNQ